MLSVSLLTLFMTICFMPNNLHAQASQSQEKTKETVYITLGPDNDINLKTTNIDTFNAISESILKEIGTCRAEYVFFQLELIGAVNIFKSIGAPHLLTNPLIDIANVSKQSLIQFGNYIQVIKAIAEEREIDISKFINDGTQSFLTEYQELTKYYNGSMHDEEKSQIFWRAFSIAQTNCNDMANTLNRLLIINLVDDSKIVPEKSQ